MQSMKLFLWLQIFFLRFLFWLSFIEITSVFQRRPYCCRHQLADCTVDTQEPLLPNLHANLIMILHDKLLLKWLIDWLTDWFLFPPGFRLKRSKRKTQRPLRLPAAVNSQWVMKSCQLCLHAAVSHILLVLATAEWTHVNSTHAECPGCHSVAIIWRNDTQDELNVSEEL